MPIARRTAAEVVDWISNRIASQRFALVITANAELVVRGLEDPEVKRIIAAADLVVPDGVGLLLAGRICGTPFPERLAGIELMETLVAASPEKGWRIALVGGRPGIAKKAARNLQAKYPGIQVVGCYHGFWSEEEEAAMLEELRAARPDLLFVALGAPRQEKWILDHREYLLSTVAMGVGGSFDVISGELKRAPKWMTAIGLEWLFRVMQEPSRLPRIMALPRFLWYVVRGRLKQPSRGNGAGPRKARRRSG